MSETKAEKKRRLLREWKLKNPDKVKEQQKRYRERHKDEIMKYNHNHYLTMKEKARKYDELMGGQA